MATGSSISTNDGPQGFWISNPARQVAVWASAHRTAFLSGGACALAVTFALAVWLWPQWFFLTFRENATLSETLEALDIGNLTAARRGAEIIARRRHPPEEEAGAAAFILGAVTFHEAEESWDTANHSGFLQASRYLEEAYDRGFPAGRELEGLRLLGKSLYLSGQVEASRPVLQEAWQISEQQSVRMELERLLADVYMNKPLSKPEEALRFNDQFLAHETLSNDDRHKGLLQRAEILLRMGRIADCLQMLDQIPQQAKNRAEVMLVHGCVFMSVAAASETDSLTAAPSANRAVVENPANPPATGALPAAQESLTTSASSNEQLDTDNNAMDRLRGNYRSAIVCFRQAQGADNLNNVVTRKAMYLTGICLQKLGNSRAAIEQFRHLQTVFPNAPEALACDLRRAELARRYSRNEESLAAYRRLLAAMENPFATNNPWFTREEARRSLMEAYYHYLQTQNFEISLQLARIAYPLLAEDVATTLTADTYRAWGESLLTRAEQMPPAEAALAEHSGRAHLRRAGMIYSRLAEMHMATEHYADDIWTSSECFLRGQNYDAAIFELKRYLDNESRRRNPPALVNLGKAQLALGKTDEALEVFQQCIDDHPLDAESYHARLWAARAYREKGDAEKARELLERIIEGAAITPSSEIWQEALFDLGQLLHAQGAYVEAIRRLDEAIRRWPESPRAMLSRYLTADAYRASAEMEKKRLRKQLVENSLLGNPDKTIALLRSAYRQYSALRDRLEQSRAGGKLCDLDRQILRNSYMGEADTLFALEDYRGAIEAYALVISRYQKRPIVLQAYLQTARAQQRLQQPEAACRTLRRAQSLLSRIAADTVFTETTNMTKQQWTKLLERLESSAAEMSVNKRQHNKHTKA